MDIYVLHEVISFICDKEFMGMIRMLLPVCKQFNNYICGNADISPWENKLFVCEYSGDQNKTKFDQRFNFFFNLSLRHKNLLGLSISYNKPNRSHYFFSDNDSPERSFMEMLSNKQLILNNCLYLSGMVVRCAQLEEMVSGRCLNKLSLKSITIWRGSKQEKISITLPKKLKLSRVTGFGTSEWNCPNLQTLELKDTEGFENSQWICPNLQTLKISSRLPTRAPDSTMWCKNLEGLFLVVNRIDLNILETAWFLRLLNSGPPNLQEIRIENISLFENASGSLSNVETVYLKNHNGGVDFGLLFEKVAVLFPRVKRLFLGSNFLTLTTASRFNHHNCSIFDMTVPSISQKLLLNELCFYECTGEPTQLFKHILELELRRIVNFEEITYTTKSPRATIGECVSNSIVSEILNMMCSSYLNLSYDNINQLKITGLGYCSATIKTETRLLQLHNFLKLKIESNPIIVQNKHLQLLKKIHKVIEAHESIFAESEREPLIRLKLNGPKLLDMYDGGLVQKVETDMNTLLSEICALGYPNIDLLLSKENWHSSDFMELGDDEEFLV